jgi:hypothetical protein
MKRKELLQAVPALALAGCAGGLGATTPTPIGLANRRLWSPNDQWNLGPGPTEWTMGPYLISFQAPEPKLGVLPQLFIYDTTESNAWVGYMWPSGSDTISYWFQDPNVYGGKKVSTLFQYNANQPVKKQLVALWDDFFWMITPAMPGGPGPGGTLYQGNSNALFSYNQNGSQLVATQYSPDAKYGFPIGGGSDGRRGPLNRTLCGAALMAYWSSLAAIIALAVAAKAGGAGKGAYWSGASASLTLFSSWWGITVECN